MRILHIYLPVLIVSLIACKNKQGKPTVLRFPGFEKAEAFYDASKYDSAFYYFNLIAINSTDSLQKATALTFMGIIQSFEGDYFGGQESYIRSLSYLDERKDIHPYCFQSNYNNLGNNSLDLKNYKDANGYFDKALFYYTNDSNRLNALNGKAVALQKTGNYKLADSLYETIIDSIKISPMLYARVLSNLTKTRWLENPHYPAAPDFLQALSIRESIKDNWGLNASYAHLSDYYTATRPDSALYYAEKMYANTHQINSPDDELEALSKLINLSSAKHLRQYSLRYQYLNDSVQTARNRAKNQFALVRYEAEKNKADNLQLQKDNALKNNQLLIGFGLTIAVFTFIMFRNRRRKQQMEAKARLQQLKTSQKVHDVVANGLYRIMTELEHKDTIEKELLIDKIEVLYERSRDISYEPPETEHHDFQNTISLLLTSFASPTTNVYITGNSQTIWNCISTQAQREVKQVLQELMINMKKHSNAQNVVLKFESQEDTIQIYYKDDGVGLPPSFKYGNGLTNTGNRINGIGGNFTFEPITKGLYIRISIPIVSTT